MSRGGSEPLQSLTIDGSIGEADDLNLNKLDEVLEVHQPPGSPPVPYDVAEIASPLVLSLAEALDGSPVAVALPSALMVDPKDRDRVAVLCALTGIAAQQGWSDTLAEIARQASQHPTVRIDTNCSPVRLEIAIAGKGKPIPVMICAIPLDGEDLGALIVAGNAAEAALDSHAALVRGVARAISAGLRVIHSQRRREQAAMALLEVARTAGSTLQLEEVLSLVTERTAKLVGADRCGLWLLSKDGTTLLPSAMAGMPADFVRVWKQRPLSLDAEPLSKEAIRTEKPVLVSDALNDPRTDKNAVQFFGDKTFLVLPVIAKGQIQGTLFINHVRFHHRYSRAEIETAMAIANQAAIAIQNARLYREVEDWSSQLERLQAIMSKLSRSRSVSSIANIIADELRNLLRYDNCRVFVLQEDTNELVPLAVVSSIRDYWVEKVENLRLEVGQGLTGYVAANGTPLIVGDVERDPRSYHVPGTPILDESMIAAPINFEGRVIGVITLSRLGLNQFTEDDLRLLDIFANEAAIEFENARLYQETQKKSKEMLAFFHRVGDALATGLDPHQTLQIIVDLAADMVRAKGCAILLLEESSGDLVYKAWKGLPFQEGQMESTPAGRGMSWQVVKEGVPNLIPDISLVERPPWMQDLGFEDLRSYLGVPLTLQGKVIGVLSVFGSRLGQFSPADVELLSSFAHQAAIAIRNAQLFKSLQERVRELTGLAGVSQSVATLTNLDDTYRELTKSIAQLLQAESCVILLVGEDGELIPQQPAFGFDPEELSGIRLSVGKKAAPQQEALCPIQSVDGETVSCSGLWNRQPSILAPMRAQDRRVGAVLVSGRPDGFNENDIRLLTILAANAAVIVQNAILYQSVDRERDELEAIISNTSDAIVIMDMDNRVTRVNPAAEALTGWRADEMVGRRCDEVLVSSNTPGRGSTSVGPTLEEAIEKREPVPYFETVITTKDSCERDVAASYSFVRSTGRGGGLGVVIARDISKLREVERMKSEFVSMVSHELRTPLGLIKGYASTLLNPQLSLDQPTVQRFLMGIDGAADRLARLVENLLSVSRIESGLLRLSTQQVDLTQLISVAVSTVRVTAKGREILLDLPKRQVKVEGDRVQLELVMDNLLGNAIKYSPIGKLIKVKLEIKPTTVTTKVVDQGIGIATHHLPKVFDKFYRVEGGYSKRTPGSGLGLYICRNIIEAHGGRIWAESVLGEGSTFAFELPLTQPRQSTSSNTQPTS
ncbi:MAG: GAF domain-containing protein [Chloroflexota bacterium]|jgi:PAS domain S-box-containing protein